MVRKATRFIDADLDTCQPLGERRSRELLVKNTLRVSQRLGSVNILPNGILDIKGTQPAAPPQHAHAVRKGAVSVLFHRLEDVEEGRAAQEHSGIEGVILRNLLADIHDPVAIAPDFGCVIKIKNAIE